MTSMIDTAPAVRERRRLSRPVAFAAIAAIFVTFAAASAAPSPLYVVYQHLWGFSATTLTVVFAVYVVGLIGSLIMLGALSDHIGRRPVLAAAIGLEVVSLILFLVAGDVSILLLARLLQGIATGAAMTTLGAALVDLNPPHAPGRAGLVNGIAPVAGLAVGALGCGALVQYGPSPTHFVWALLLAGMLLAAIVVARIPETSARRPGAAASLAPRLGIPARLRADVLALSPIIIASWAIGGLYLSLGPSVAAGVFELSSHLIGGLVVTLLCGTGALTSYALRNVPTRRVLTIAGSLLTVGAVLSVIGLELGSALLAAGGTVVSGVGFGASALASFGTLAVLAAPHERGELFAVALVIAYVAFSVPAVIAGFAATSAGLHTTALVYGLVVATLSAVALVAQRMRTKA
ncbi:MFS transporter [Paractinoplanes brasiliensis]|uniref:Putative MFS family arabinose efflux permease n=1 Tax=Paractinoplanes brasiliensis TaxID=52695 RepID=A0A4R6JR05_9ACTN|nr:MFS transporter [Actinoplanes brasiliensis]TDO39043.1 putative MFS family arabinose efflux permease [Actinoplanes brasiliensis]GID30258.1 MFS transporter [Actinoplanes brasiliensis]